MSGRPMAAVQRRVCTTNLARLLHLQHLSQRTLEHTLEIGTRNAALRDAWKPHLTAARTQAARTRRVALVFTTERTLNLHCIGLACRAGESQRARLLSARHRCPLPAFHTPRLTACSPYGLCSALGHARPCHADLILSLCCRPH
jgi:hypothetical protein